MSEAEHTTEGIKYLDPPDKSEYDKTEYRVVRLQNGLTALLISKLDGANYDDINYEDREEGNSSERVKGDISKAFCSLCVRVGSFNDPLEFRGLAHLLERMVFMGSKKYPENFNEFVSLYGGNTNSATGCEYTRFYFDISVKQLEPALDHFVQFFIDHPSLMKEDAIAREQKIIENEFQSCFLSCDKSRKELVLTDIARIGPPPKRIYWKALTSHNNTYDGKLYEELHKFRECHYSAHKMTLAIQARLPLDTLERYVTDSFAGILSNWLSFDSNYENNDKFFDTVVLKKMYKVRSIKDISQLHVIWILPSKFNQYKSKPYKYISSIIENKRSGSLTSYLRKKLWALDLFCLVKRTGPQEWIYNEFYKIERNNFRFFNKHDDVFDLCKSMHFYPPRDYLTGKHNYFEYNSEAVEECLEFLKPETVNIMNFGNDLDLDMDEPRLRTYCSITALPKEWIENWKSIEPLPYFHLLLLNAFIIDNISLISGSAETLKYPVKIQDNDILEIWYCPKFYWPMCHINLHIVCSLKIETPKDAALLDMYCSVLKYLLVEELHPAVTAGYDYGIDVSAEDIGITIQMSGFGEKLPILLKIITNCIIHLFVSKDLFEVIKAQQLKAYYHKFMETEKFIKDVKLWILKRPYYTYVHKYDSLYKDINVEDFQDFVTSFTNYLSIQCLVQGNITKDRTIDTVNIIQSFITQIHCPFSTNTKSIKVAILPQCIHYKLKNINHKYVNSVVTNYYQIGVATTESSVLIELILMMMKESLRNYPRRQGLSNVSCDLRNIKKILGYSMTVYIQENKYSFDSVDDVIEDFQNSFTSKLYQFSETELDHVKERLRILKQHDEHAEILRNGVDRNWSEITKQQYIFNRHEVEALAIENINKRELVNFFQTSIRCKARLKKLRVCVEGTPKEIALSKQITFQVQTFV
ncbi:Nardilysin [Trachymyrmex septentrionalis]|uniref:Nardilysin n=1 Tax=Trachymyrmex septentrionalis TaxID=34720 RepID=A0A195FYC8_9HYME|nr:Nardilysin [Trachymyrmex septentrionalis]